MVVYLASASNDFETLAIGAFASEGEAWEAVNAVRAWRKDGEPVLDGYAFAVRKAPLGLITLRHPEDWT
jgi:hypothetical protein